MCFTRLVCAKPLTSLESENAPAHTWYVAATVVDGKYGENPLLQDSCGTLEIARSVYFGRDDYPTDSTRGNYDTGGRAWRWIVANVERGYSEINKS